MIEKEIKVKIKYTQKLCGEVYYNKYMGWQQFEYCPMVDNDCDDYCHAYQTCLNLDKDNHPYRCKQCIKENK